MVTGSSDGLGRELALAFFDIGYNIIIHGRDLDKIKNIAQGINGITMVSEGKYTR